MAMLAIQELTDVLMKVLLVEDSATLRHAHIKYIEQAGHTPVAVSSGEEALQLIDNTPIDMVIMDVDMPGLNGFETTRLMREWLADHWVPIIFVTGRNDDESLREGIEAGGDDYLIKPVSPVILNAKIAAMQRIMEMRDELHTLNLELENISQKDALTKLYNRRAFNDFGEKQWMQCHREQVPVSVLMIDIDHFKHFNDIYGHPVGDECLVQVSDAMRQCVHRPNDILARYGGEEFVVLLPGTDRQGAKRVANAIREAIEALDIENSGSTTSRRVTASIGCATTRHTKDKTVADLVQCGDRALYRAKRQGRNRVVVDELSLVSNILVADSDANTVDFINQQMAGACQITSADTAEECLELVQLLQPDLIVIDHRIEGMKETALVGQLKNYTHSACIPILLYTQGRTVDLKRMAKKLGAPTYLRKSTDSDKLLPAIKRYLHS